MRLLNDTEQRIFLAAMSREEAICRELDEKFPDGQSLTKICHSIKDKVNSAGRIEDAEWIPADFKDKDNKTFRLYRCSECDSFSLQYGLENYCSHCGKRMHSQFIF